MTTQDADLIRELRWLSDSQSLLQKYRDMLKAAAARLEELTQPAPEGRIYARRQRQGGDWLDWHVCSESEAMRVTGLNSWQVESADVVFSRNPREPGALMAMMASVHGSASQEAPARQPAPGAVNVPLTRGPSCELLEAAQPAPLALSPDLAQIWATRVIQARVGVARTGIDEAIMEVDALLRKRVQRLTDEQIKAIWTACPTSDNALLTFARAVEAAHGIGEGAK